MALSPKLVWWQNWLQCKLPSPFIEKASLIVEITQFPDLGQSNIPRQVTHSTQCLLIRQRETQRRLCNEQPWRSISHNLWWLIWIDPLGITSELGHAWTCLFDVLTSSGSEFVGRILTTDVKRAVGTLNMVVEFIREKGHVPPGIDKISSEWRTHNYFWWPSDIGWARPLHNSASPRLL